VDFVLLVSGASPIINKIGSSAKSAWTVEKTAEAAVTVRRVEAVVGAAEAANVARAEAAVVDLAETGVQWGKGIQAQGMPFENYIASTLPAEMRLFEGCNTFDFFDKELGIATSVKTLDTATAAKIANPKQVYYSLKRNVDTVANFTEARRGGFVLRATDISTRELVVGIPESTTSAQWAEISRAIQYGKSKNITVKITVVK